MATYTQSVHDKIRNTRPYHSILCRDVVNVAGLASADTAYLNVTGSISGDPRDDYRFAFAGLELASTDFAIDNYAEVYFFYDGTSVTTDISGSYGNTEIIVNSLTASNFDITLRTWFMIPGSDPDATVIASVGAVSWPETTTAGVTADIRGTLSIELLDGLAYDQESGVLLTQAVPIPPSVWLFGAGLLGLAGVARRGKSSWPAR